MMTQINLEARVEGQIRQLLKICKLWLSMPHSHYGWNILQLEVLLGSGTESQNTSYLPRLGVPIRYHVHGH